VEVDTKTTCHTIELNACLCGGGEGVVNCWSSDHRHRLATVSSQPRPPFRQAAFLPFLIDPSHGRLQTRRQQRLARKDNHAGALSRSTPQSACYRNVAAAAAADDHPKQRAGCSGLHLLTQTADGAADGHGGRGAVMGGLGGEGTSR